MMRPSAVCRRSLVHGSIELEGEEEHAVQGMPGSCGPDLLVVQAGSRTIPVVRCLPLKVAGRSLPLKAAG